MSQICKWVPEVDEKFQELKKTRKNLAMIMKIVPKQFSIVVEDMLEVESVEELQEELPDAAPRYIAMTYVYTHKDGRVSYPLCFIYYAPPQINPTTAMMYSSSLQQLYSHMEIARIFELSNPEDLTTEWLQEKLAYFG